MLLFTPTETGQTRGRRTTRPLGVAAFALTLFALDGLTNSAAAQKQCRTQWSDTRTLTTSDRPVYVESPAAFRIGSRLGLVGAPALTWATARIFDPEPGATPADTNAYFDRWRQNNEIAGFALRDSTALPLQLPGRIPPRKAVAVMDGRQTVHVVWVGPAEVPAESATDTTEADNTIWYAELSDSGWSTPIQLFHAKRLDWSGSRPILLVRDESIHVLVAYIGMRDAGIVHLRRLAGRWTTTTLRLAGLPSQVSAQLLDGDSIIVAYAGIGAPGIRERNGQHIYVLRSSSRDTNSVVARRIEWSGLDAIRWLGLYEQPAKTDTPSRFVLIWARQPASGADPDVLLSLVSGDRGLTWKPGDAVMLPRGTKDAAQTQTTSGAVQVVVSTRRRDGDARPTMHAAILHSGRWSPFEDLPIHASISAPGLTAIGLDSTLLTWGEGRLAAPTDATRLAPITEYKWSVVRCIQ